MATDPESLCDACRRWREEKLDQVAEDHKEQIEARLGRFYRNRMSPDQRFAEGLADMVKAVERSRR